MGLDMNRLKTIFNKITQFADRYNVSLAGAGLFLQGAGFTAFGVNGILNHQDGTTAVPAKMTLGIGIAALVLVSAGYAYSLYSKNKAKQANILRLK